MKEVNFISAQDLTGRSLEMQKRPTAEEAKKISADAKAAYAKMPAFLQENTAFQNRANAQLAAEKSRK
jgi:hypothetical protein